MAHTASPFAGKLADPEFRRLRATKAAQARTTLEAHIRAVVSRAPEMTNEQRDRLALLLRGGDAA